MATSRAIRKISEGIIRSSNFLYLISVVFSLYVIYLIFESIGEKIEELYGFNRLYLCVIVCVVNRARAELIAWGGQESTRALHCATAQHHPTSPSPFTPQIHARTLHWCYSVMLSPLHLHGWSRLPHTGTSRFTPPTPWYWFLQFFYGGRSRNSIRCLRILFKPHEFMGIVMFTPLISVVFLYGGDITLRLLLEQLAL